MITLQHYKFYRDFIQNYIFLYLMCRTSPLRSCVLRQNAINGHYVFCSICDLNMYEIVVYGIKLLDEFPQTINYLQKILNERFRAFLDMLMDR